MARVIAFLSTACLLLLLFRPGGILSRKALDSPALLHEIRGLNELVTVRYTLQRVVRMTESKVPVGSEQILLLVEGRVLAGIDLADLTAGDVSMPDRHSAHIRLAPPRIIDAFLDEKNTQVWDRRITWWTPWVSPSPDLEHNARLQALEDIRAAAVRMGIYAEARKDAETDIRKILGAFGIDRVEFAAKAGE